VGEGMGLATSAYEAERGDGRREARLAINMGDIWSSMDLDVESACCQVILVDGLTVTICFPLPEQCRLLRSRRALLSTCSSWHL
jgi:hypothetical protein